MRKKKQFTKVKNPKSQKFILRIFFYFPIHESLSKKFREIFIQKGSLIKVSTINCNCINNFEKQIQGIHSKKEETKMSQTKGEQHLMDLNKTVNFICKKIDEFERDIVEKEEIINELEKNQSRRRWEKK